MVDGTITANKESAAEMVRQAQQRAAERPARIEEIKRSLEYIYRPGDVLEVRVIGIPGNNGYPPHNASGYFNDLDKAAAAILNYDDRGGNVYVTINPTIPDLLARASNRIVERAKTTTGDGEIQLRSWLPIDIDPHRASGIPANAAECDSAHALSVRVDTLLRAEGWGHPLFVFSGNGRYSLYRIDLPNDAPTTALLEAFYPALALALGEPDKTKPYSKIDTGVFNASRILRPGGTTNRKGDGTPDRPHRRCVYLAPVPGCPVDVVPAETIRAFVEKYGQPATHTTSSTGSPSANGTGHRLDVPRYLQAHGVAFKAKPADGGAMYVVACPFDQAHGSNGESAVYQANSGLLTFECKHSSCQGKKWEHYRDAIGKPDPDHYDPPLRSGNAQARTATPPTITYMPVAVGTVVQAGDRGNYGTVVADHGQSCLVHFQAKPEDGGGEKEKTLPKTELRLQDGKPLIEPAIDFEVRTVRDLLPAFPKLRPPVVHGLLRQGETMNIISTSKLGKSWLVTDFSLCMATGRDWLGIYSVDPGRVLIVDNELHPETTANRIPKIADARGIPLNEYADAIQVVNLRGKLVDIHGLATLFDRFEPGELRVVVIDAFYRTIPDGTDENDNAAIAHLYNEIDRYALRLGCCFVLIHHSSKGNQSGKTITDVGAGAGSQSRAADTHLILRPHLEPGAVVVEAAVRSWPPVAPRCLRWQFPVWNLANDLDPADLKPERPAKRKAPPAEQPQEETAPRWTPERFVSEFVTDQPRKKDAILTSAMSAGLTHNLAVQLLRLANGAELIHKWPTADKRRAAFATIQPPLLTPR